MKRSKAFDSLTQPYKRIRHKNFKKNISIGLNPADRNEFIFFKRKKVIDAFQFAYCGLQKGCYRDPNVMNLFARDEYRKGWTAFNQKK